MLHCHRNDISIKLPVLRDRFTSAVDTALYRPIFQYIVSFSVADKSDMV